MNLWKLLVLACALSAQLGFSSSTSNVSKLLDAVTAKNKNVLLEGYVVSVLPKPETGFGKLYLALPQNLLRLDYLDYQDNGYALIYHEGTFARYALAKAEAPRKEEIPTSIFSRLILSSLTGIFKKEKNEEAPTGLSTLGNWEAKYQNNLQYLSVHIAYLSNPLTLTLAVNEDFSIHTLSFEVREKESAFFTVIASRPLSLPIDALAKGVQK